MAGLWAWHTAPLTGLSFLGMVIGAVIVLLLILGIVSYLIYFERKVIGWMQNRIGPNRVGPFGLLQSVADILKLLLKEDIIPANADRALFLLAPIIAFVPSFMVLAIIPFTATHVFTAGLNVGVLYYIALSSITILGIVMAGWASNNKYSLLGGMRSAAQMISYEIPLGLSMLGVIMLSGSLNLNTIVAAQNGHVWFIIPQIIGLGGWLIASTSAPSRTPSGLSDPTADLGAG